MADQPPQTRPSTPSTAPTMAARADGPGGLGESLPAQIGPYKVVKKLGRGGMGVVLLAVRDDDQFHKRVAIKLIRRGIDTAADGKEVLKRFDLERQVLGALNHPNIARLLDAGQLPEPDGRPYFVMEYVEGEPIDEFCDRMQLDTEQRLTLFKKVCAAVHHAHQNLVIHRDIKPGNILVDTAGEPKLMDFGIAKLINPAMGALTLATVHDRGPMTPEYASPEQVQGKPVSTASDVYALGVLMYELLTGRRPYRLKSKAIDAMVRAICEDEPERPSTAVTHEEVLEAHDGETRTVTADTLAKPREGAVTRLKRKLAGDVDNIVLMAMRKSPQRRYASAEAMAADIQRHLDGQPVTAAPDSLLYRTSKFVRRNKIGVAAALVVLCALVAGLVMVEHGRRTAQQAAAAEREIARKQEALAKDYLEIFGKYFADLGAAIRRLEGTTDARYQLAAAALPQLEAIAPKRQDDPGFLRMLSQNYALVSDVLGGERGGNKGDPARAREPLEKALAISDDLFKRFPADSANRRLHAGNLIRLGDLRKKLKDLGQPLEAYERAVKALQSPDGSDPTDPDLLRSFSIALIGRADAVAQSQSPDTLARAGEDYDKALAIRQKRFESRPGDAEAERDFTITLNRVAGWYARQDDRNAKAREMYERALHLREGLMARDPNAKTKRDTLVAAEALARFHLDYDAPAGAAAPLAQARRLGDELEKTDSDSARVDEDLCLVALAEGDLAHATNDNTRAADRFAEAVRRARASLDRNPSSLKAKYTLALGLNSEAAALEKLGKPAAALRKFTDARPLWNDLTASGSTPAYSAGSQACDEGLTRLEGR